MSRAGLAERIDNVEQRMDSMEQRLDASFNALSTQILESRRENDGAHSAMRTEFARDMSTFRTEVAGEFSTMRAGFESLEAAIGDSRGEVTGQFSDVRVRFEKLEIALANGLEDSRRFMMIVHEDTLARIALIGEGRPSSS